MPSTPPPRPRRILILNHNLRDHGTYFRAIKVAEELAALGHRVTFVTSGTHWYRGRTGRRGSYDYAESPSRSFLHHPDDGWSPFGVLWRSVTYAWRRWDMVYAFSHKPVDQIPARLASIGRRTVLAVDWCDLYGGEGILGMRRSASRERGFRAMLRRVCDAFEEKLERAIIRRAHIVTVIGSDLRARARKLAPTGEVHVMPSGAETRRIRPMNRAACRAKLDLPASRPIMGYIANYHPDETLLLDALAIVIAKRPDAMLLAVGNGFYGGEAAMESRGIASHVNHIGRVPFAMLARALGACDVLLVPMSDTPFNRSRWPHKIGDYVAAGRAQVACGVGDVPAVFDETGVGAHTAPNAEAFAAGILALLDDEPRRREMERAARRAARTRFSWTARVGGFRTALERATGLRL